MAYTEKQIQEQADKYAEEYIGSSHYAVAKEAFLACAQWMQEREKTQVVPYQRCPVCNDDGEMLQQGFISGCHRTCTTCNGTKIIPMHVLPSPPKD